LAVFLLPGFPRHKVHFGPLAFGAVLLLAQRLPLGSARRATAWANSELILALTAKPMRPPDSLALSGCFNQPSNSRS
jgi:hypothetical protein